MDFIGVRLLALSGEIADDGNPLIGVSMILSLPPSWGNAAKWMDGAFVDEGVGLDDRVAGGEFETQVDGRPFGDIPFGQAFQEIGRRFLIHRLGFPSWRAERATT